MFAASLCNRLSSQLLRSHQKFLPDDADATVLFDAGIHSRDQSHSVDLRRVRNGISNVDQTKVVGISRREQRVDPAAAPGQTQSAGIELFCTPIHHLNSQRGKLNKLMLHNVSGDFSRIGHQTSADGVMAQVFVRQGDLQYRITLVMRCC